MHFLSTVGFHGRDITVRRKTFTLSLILCLVSTPIGSSLLVTGIAMLGTGSLPEVGTEGKGGNGKVEIELTTTGGGCLLSLFFQPVFSYRTMSMTQGNNGWSMKGRRRRWKGSCNSLPLLPLSDPLFPVLAKNDALLFLSATRWNFCRRWNFDPFKITPDLWPYLLFHSKGHSRSWLPLKMIITPWEGKEETEQNLSLTSHMNQRLRGWRGSSTYVRVVSTQLKQS